MIKTFKITFSIISITAVTVVCLLWLRENNLFILNRVKVVGNNFISNEEIIELADLDFSKEVFHLDGYLSTQGSFCCPAPNPLR